MFIANVNEIEVTRNGPYTLRINMCRYIISLNVFSFTQTNYKYVFVYIFCSTRRMVTLFRERAFSIFKAPLSRPEVTLKHNFSSLSVFFSFSSHYSMLFPLNVYGHDDNVCVAYNNTSK